MEVLSVMFLIIGFRITRINTTKPARRKITPTTNREYAEARHQSRVQECFRWGLWASNTPKFLTLQDVCRELP